MGKPRPADDANSVGTAWQVQCNVAVPLHVIFLIMIISASQARSLQVGHLKKVRGL